MTAIVRRLDEVCSITMGQAPKGEAYNTSGEGWPLIAGAGDFSNGAPVPNKFTTEASKLSAYGDIILGIRASIGNKVWSDSVYCLGRGVAGLQPKPMLDSNYLWHWLTHATPALAVKGKGATFKQVNRQDIGEMSIALPSLDEQRRIAAILDQAYALRTKRRETLVRLEDLTQSIFLDMFSPPEVQGWPTATVQEIADAKKGSIRTGPFGSQLLHSEFVDEGIAVLGIDNAVANEFRWGERRYIDEMKYRVLSRYRVYPGDVLITIMGTCGRCAVVPDGIPLAINTKHLCCITTDPRECLPEFLHASFLWQPVSRSYLERAAKGAIMAGLNMGIIKGMPLVLPPITVQQEFVERVAAVEAAKLTSGASASQLDDLFSSLQARAFSGQL